MKIFLFVVAFWLSILQTNAQVLGIIESNNPSDIRLLFEQEDVRIHFYKDNFAILSGEYMGNLPYSVIEINGFEKDFNYFLQHTNKTEKSEVEESVSGKGEILFSNKEFSILKIGKQSMPDFYPLTNDALVYFNENTAALSDDYGSKFKHDVSFDHDIESMIEDINIDSIESSIYYLSNYATRNCYSSQITNALNWIKTKFESYKLDVTTQSLSSYGIPSFNVIATQTGATYPDEYVVIGGHADSRSNTESAPGADDNASGVAGVLEIARILSEYTFDRSIIYCAFSGEEYGLFGSNYFANQFKNDDKNIIGYLNLDMIGYKDPDQALSSSLIYPGSAKPLADFYKSICLIYLPDFNVMDGALVNADSDHTSFNEAGYMGIFPFENVEYYSPYIHTSNDIPGLSVNSFELAENLTSAALASVASLADHYANVSNNDQLNQSSSFIIYPNPASDYLTISFKSEQIADIEIFSILGQSLIRDQITGPTSIDVSSLSSGTYIIKLTSGNHSTIQKINIK